MDLFVVQEVVVENKVAEQLAPLHKAQGLSYLKTVGKTVVIVFPVALRDIQAVHLDSVKDWLRRCDIRLGIVANFDALRLQTVFVRA